MEGSRGVWITGFLKRLSSILTAIQLKTTSLTREAGSFQLIFPLALHSA